MTDLLAVHRRAAEVFDARVEAIADEHWPAPTPCERWSVRDLVAHLVRENRWAPHLLSGQALAEVGDRYEGDVLGDDPKAAWRASLADALAATEAHGALEGRVHTSAGEVPARVYVEQRTVDLAIHGWDLARGIGADDTLPDEVVRHLWDTWSERQAELRASGMFDDPPALEPGASLQTRVLAVFGRRG